MTAEVHNFDVEAGATWRCPLEYRNTDGTPFVLAGWSARMSVRSRRGERLLDLNSDDNGIAVDGPAGTVTVTITAEQTAALPAGRVLYDIELVSPDGEVTRLVTGSLTVDAR